MARCFVAGIVAETSHTITYCGIAEGVSVISDKGTHTAIARCSVTDIIISVSRVTGDRVVPDVATCCEASLISFEASSIRSSKLKPSCFNISNNSLTLNP